MDRYLILVTLGTNGYPFDRINKIIAGTEVFNAVEVEWFFQTGGQTIVPPVGKCTVKDFISLKEMKALYGRCDLIIGHCGMGTIYNSLVYRKKTILVPRLEKYGEFSDDHQLQIAAQIKSELFSVLMEDCDLNLGVRELKENIEQSHHQIVNKVLSHEIYNRIKKYCNEN